MKKILIILILLASTGCTSSKQDKPNATLITPLVYKVTLPNNTYFYLMGTVHVGSGNIQFSKQVEDVFLDIDALMLEVNPEKINVTYNSTYQSIHEIGNLSSLDIDNLDKHLESIGSSYHYEQLKKYNLMSIISLVGAEQLEKLNYSAKYGIEALLYEKAKTSHIPILELEGVAFQFSLFDEINGALTHEMLTEYLAYLSPTEQDIVVVTMEGDKEELESILNTTREKSPELLNELMLDNRNIEWVEKIEEALAISQKPMVAVGALHLVGDKGLIQLFENKGYKVERIR